MARNSNGFLSTDTELIGFGGGKEYSGASGVFVDNVNNIISITGDVGKVYSGIDPIVVNNEESLISANSAPIGVQEPLYFVQDDDEGLIIGLSGDTGDEEVNELVHTNSGTWNEVSSKLDSTAYTPFDPTYMSGVIDEKLNTTAFSTVSGDFLTAHQDLSDYYKKTETSSKDEIANALQYVSANAGKVYEGVSPIVVNNVENKVSADTWTLSAGSNVALVDDNVNKITRIDCTVTGESGDPEVNALVHSNSGTWNTVTGKLDTTAFSNVSGDFLTAHQDLSNYYTKDETSGKEQLAQAFANIPAGDTEVNAYVHNNSASIDGTKSLVQSNSSTWTDITAYQSNSASYLTAVNIPESATWNDVSTTVQSNSAQWAEGGGTGGDEEVNSFVRNNSATINEVNTTYQANSGSYQPAGNYIPYTAVEGGVIPSFKTNSGLQINKYSNGGLNSTLMDWSTIQLRYVDLSFHEGSVLSNSDLKFENTNDSAYVDMEKIHTWDSVSNYIQSISATYADVSTTVQSNSANWGQGGGAISSYTTAYSHDIPPYGGEVIDSLNGKFLSAYISRSAANAATAHISNTATYAQTVDETKLENDGFVKNLTSEYGTISVVHNTIESTNSAISRVGNEGFVSSFQDKSIGPTLTANFSWDKSLPNTTFNFTENYASTDTTITYSANTNLTGEVTVTSVGQIPFSVSVPNATELNVWSNDWVQIIYNVASAADTFETVVGELAWASALPTYQYDSTNKISAINGSAIAAGDEFPASADEAIQYVQTNSANIDETVTSYQTNSGDYLKESELGYNAVDEVSAINGSAIAQYGAEKQWLVHDDTLVHASNSAQYALGCNISALQRLMGIDETVLYENANGGVVNTANTFTLNESLQNFEMIKIIDNSLPVGGDRRLTTIPVSTSTISIATNDAWFDVSYNPTSNASKYIGVNFYSANAEGTQIATNGSYIKNMAATGAWTNRNEGRLYKIIGVHRISG